MPVATADLRIAYDQHGPADAPVVLLLHGWPDQREAPEKVAGLLVPFFSTTG